MKEKKRKRFLHLTTLTVMSIAVTAVAAVAVSVICFISVYNDSLIRDASVNSQQSVQQTGAALGNYLDDMKSQLIQISNEISKSTDLEDVSKRINIAARLQTDIAAVSVYSKDGSLLACGSDNHELKEGDFVNLSYDSDLFPKNDEYAFSLPHVQSLFKEYYPWVVTVVHREELELFGGEVWIAVDYSFNVIAKYVDNVGIGRRGYCCIIDTDGNIVYHPQQQMIFSGLFKETLDAVSNHSDGVYIGDGVIHTLFTVDDSSWRVVGVSFTDDLTEAKTTTIISVVLIAFICCGLIALFAAMLFLNTVSRPVKRLAFAMKEFEENAGTYEYEPKGTSIAELQDLSGSFDHMVVMIQSLMKQVRDEEITLRKTELRALQTQINPHFLYNTLDSIQWMCERGKNEEAVKMVGALAKLFRISISRGHELISIRDEMRHAESYLIIQSFRYKNRFSYSFNIDPETEECLCNKITVQPLIENAIYHGIEPMVDEGEISITVRQGDNNDIFIDVKDNGVGMTEEQCRSILMKDHSDSSGIGIKNVNDRLKIYFGENYGISIESEPDFGTTISVHIPKIGKEQNDEA